MAVEEVFIGFGVSSIIGFTLISCVVFGASVVTFDVPSLSIGTGVSSMRVGPPVDPSSIPSVDIVDWIIPVLAVPEVTLEVEVEGIGLGVSPVDPYVDNEFVVCELGDVLDVDFETPSVDIGFGVSPIDVGLSLDPKVVSRVDIDAVWGLVGAKDDDLEVPVVYIGFGVSPIAVGP